MDSDSNPRQGRGGGEIALLGGERGAREALLGDERRPRPAPGGSLAGWNRAGIETQPTPLTEIPACQGAPISLETISPYEIRGGVNDAFKGF